MRQKSEVGVLGHKREIYFLPPSPHLRVKRMEDWGEIVSSEQDRTNSNSLGTSLLLWRPIQDQAIQHSNREGAHKPLPLPGQLTAAGRGVYFSLGMCFNKLPNTHLCMGSKTLDSVEYCFKRTLRCNCLEEGLRE